MSGRSGQTGYSDRQARGRSARTAMVPTLPHTYPVPTTVCTHHVPCRACTAPGYHRFVPAGTSVHQAHAVKMEILSVKAPADTVSRRHKRPAPDTVTTFQNLEMGRVLIVQNAKRISCIWEQRGIFLAQKRKTAKIRENTGTARKRTHAKVPFQAGSVWPNSNTRSVVSGLVMGILLSSVIPFLVL